MPPDAACTRRPAAEILQSNRPKRWTLRSGARPECCVLQIREAIPRNSGTVENPELRDPQVLETKHTLSRRKLLNPLRKLFLLHVSNATSSGAAWEQVQHSFTRTLREKNRAHTLSLMMLQQSEFRATLPSITSTSSAIISSVSTCLVSSVTLMGYGQLPT